MSKGPEKEWKAKQEFFLGFHKPKRIGGLLFSSTMPELRSRRNSWNSTCKSSPKGLGMKGISGSPYSPGRGWWEILT